jgi:hypothetical protein|tara:strand:- start:871 stop:1860 length:990 start_codon:yes stop_codon:yes gene_type:complete
VRKLLNILLEGIDLPIKIGDTVRMGKFKNKKVVIKKIEWNEKGDLLINGRPALKFRLMPETNVFDEGKLEESKQEFVIWGIPPKKSSEEILYTKAKSNSEAKKVVKILTKKHGVKRARIQVLDLEQDPSKFWKSDNIFEGTSKIKKVIAIYPGRFQPFGPHHKKVYLALKKKFGDVYIVTSNIQKPPRHPMNFKEKVQHMTKMGIPSNKIIMDNPYKPVNLLKKFKSEETAAVFAVGEKDKGRLSSGYYFDDYNKNKNNLKGYKEHGYVIKAPHISVNVAGKEVSGTTMRQILGSSKIKPEQRRKLFKQLFGYFNDSVYKMMIGNFKNV